MQPSGQDSAALRLPHSKSRPIRELAILLAAFVFALPLLAVGQTSEAWTESLYQRALILLNRGNLQDAAKDFEAVLAREPSHAGAMLDLASTYCRMGQKTKADELLSILEIQFDPPQQIQNVIKQLRIANCRSPELIKWSFAVGLGHDSNINQGSDARSIFINTGDSYSEFFLASNFLPISSNLVSTTGLIKKSISSSTALFAAFSGKFYENKYREFDNALILGGIEKNINLRTWGALIDLGVGAKSLGNSLYQELLMSQVQLSPDEAANNKTSRTNLSLGILYSRYPKRTAFDSLELALLTQRTFSFNKSIQLRGSFGWNKDLALKGRPGGDRGGPLFGLEFNIRLSPSDRLLAGLQKRELKSEDPYAPPFFISSRQQKTDLLSIGLERGFSLNQTAKIEFTKLHNRDSIPIYDHRRRLLLLSWTISSE